MKIKILVILILIAVALTVGSSFIKVVPCKSWYGSNTGMEDLMPHNTFCNLISGTISFGPYKEYYYLTSNPTIAFLITLAIFLLIVFIIGMLLSRRKS